MAQTLLGQEIGPLGASLQAQGWRVRLVDGTSLPAGGPGKGYHRHACFDLGAQCFDELILTSAPSVRELDAESLARHPAGPGEIVVADRNFAQAAGGRATIAQGGQLIVRRGLTACRIAGEDGRPLDAAAILDLARDGTEDGAIVDIPVWLPAAADAPARQLRLIIQKKPPEAAEKSQKRAARKAQRAHYEAKSKQIDAARYLMLMTTLDEATMPAAQVLALYRRRRQIELAFKRLKSLAGLDNIQAREERLAKTAIWAKLILAILTETLLGRVLALSPSGKTIALAPLPSPSPAPRSPDLEPKNPKAYRRALTKATRNLAEPPRRRRYQWTRLGDVVS